MTSCGVARVQKFGAQPVTCFLSLTFPSPFSSPLPFFSCPLLSIPAAKRPLNPAMGLGKRCKVPSPAGSAGGAPVEKYFGHILSPLNATVVFSVN